MKFHFSFLLVTLLLVTSCATSNHVNSNRLIQKRKFNKGWHINISGLNSSKKSTSVEKNESPISEATRTESKTSDLDLVLHENHPDSPNENDILVQNEVMESAEPDQLQTESSMKEKQKLAVPYSRDHNQNSKVVLKRPLQKKTEKFP